MIRIGRISFIPSGIPSGIPAGIPAAMLAGGLLAGVFGSAPALAADTSFDADFVVTLRGFTVGRANFAGSVDGDRYQVHGSLKSAGIARIFARTEASAQASGRISQGAVQPDSFLLNYAQDDQLSRTAIVFRNGDAISTRVEPKPAAPSAKAIPITGADLKSVADPVAATLLARGTADQICGRTLRIYEGGTRIDVRLALKGTGFVYGAGNRAVTCTGRFIPVAGMERDNKTYDFMREKADLQFVYVPAGPGGLHMLHSLTARTEIGTVQLRSWRRKVKG